MPFFGQFVKNDLDVFYFLVVLIKILCIQEKIYNSVLFVFKIHSAKGHYTLEAQRRKKAGAITLVVIAPAFTVKFRLLGARKQHTLALQIVFVPFRLFLPILLI